MLYYINISCLCYKDNGGKKYKVTRRIQNMSVAETRIFDSLEEAKKQFDDWLK